MASSLIASFFGFALVGAVTLFVDAPEIFSDFNSQFVKIFVGLSLLFNAIYYYYMAAKIETDQKMRNALAGASRREWLIRLLNQTLLFSLWFVLRFGWAAFFGTLTALYLLYLLWDVSTWQYLPKKERKPLLVLDLLGTGLSIVAWYQLKGLQSQLGNQYEQLFTLGICTMGYLLIALAGLLYDGFSLFQKGYWRKPELH